MKRFDIVVPKKYQKNGEEKTAWNRVGTLVHFPANGDKDEGYILELSMYQETTFKVFEQKPKENNQSQPAAQNNDGDPGPSDADVPW